MLPMCYPADHMNGNFIPNWAMWFVVQLEEYAARSGDRELVEALRPRVLKLLDYFKRFENSDGLLEKLEKWVFVEWSAANKFVQDVNYPSSMLYSGTLDAAARLYRLPDLAAKAARIRDTIRTQSFDGEFFVDNALRKDGKLEVTRNRTEVWGGDIEAVAEAGMRGGAGGAVVQQAGREAVARGGRGDGSFHLGNRVVHAILPP